MNKVIRVTHMKVGGAAVMALSKKPVTGMKDILPEEMKIPL